MLEAILLEGAGALGIPLPSGALPSFRAYHDYLYEQNALMDLTAVLPEDEAARIHFLDSLALLPHVPEGSSVLDVGSGAGFPGLPLRLAEPSLHLTLLDSSMKRTEFLRRLCPLCGADDVCVLCGRAEELSLLPAYRETFDVVASRAVARFSMLAELCLPFVRPGGVLLAMKAAGCEAEVREAEDGVKLLGGILQDPVFYRICGSDVTRVIVPVRKIRPTPAAYPRRFSKIKAKPL